MNDCPNAEIRDRLPDLVHDRLSVSARAAVLAHVGNCADCKAELELLRRLNEMFVARSPRVNVASIVAALPKPAARAARRSPSRFKWTDWRVAAAVALLVGGTSYVTVSRLVPPQQTIVDRAPATAPARSTPTASAPVVQPAAPTAAPPVTPSPTATFARPVAETVAAAAEDQALTSDLGSGGRLADLNERQLKALLGEIDRLQAVPVTEPEPVTMRVNTRNSSLPEAAWL